MAKFTDRISEAWRVLFEHRQSPENPTTPLSAPAGWLFDMLGGSPTVSGARINERTALQVSAVYACVRVIAESIGSLPLHVYRRLEPRGREKAVRTREYALLHNAPNERMTACIFREVMTAHVLLFGNAYALIEFDQSGKTRAIWPLMPNLVTPNLRSDRRLEYIVKDAIANIETTYPADEIIHIPGLSFDGVGGVSPIIYHREGIGLSAALETFGAEYFGHGTAPSGVLTFPGALSPAAKERLSSSWHSSHGMPGVRHKVAVLEEGMEYKPNQIQADHAQFIESRKFQITEIARIFRVPAHLIGDLERATFSNIEQQSLEFVEYTLRPWLVRWEQELNRKLFPGPSEFTESEFYVEHNIDGLLRGDFASRMAGYTTLRQWGLATPNEIREKENWNPLSKEDGGDQILVPSNMTTPELLTNPPEPKPAPTPPEVLPLEPKPNGNGDKARFKRVFSRIFAETIRRCLNYERKDPAKLERLVSMSFAPVLASMAEHNGADIDVAIHYAGLLHGRIADWAAELDRRCGQDAPMAEILERELELAYNFLMKRNHPMLEYRANPGVELRQTSGESPKIGGYAAVFNQLSEVIFGFRERILPGAFKRSLGNDVRALVNHDPSAIIGRTKSGTLTLREDERGLYSEITPPNTTLGRDTVESIRRGDLDQMSFGFQIVKDDWKHEEKQLIREIHEVELFDVSVVAFPAYTQTSVSVRSLWPDGVPEEIEKAKEKAEKPVEPSAARKRIEDLERQFGIKTPNPDPKKGL